MKKILNSFILIKNYVTFTYKSECLAVKLEVLTI